MININISTFMYRVDTTAPVARTDGGRRAQPVCHSYYHFSFYFAYPSSSHPPYETDEPD